MFDVSVRGRSETIISSMMATWAYGEVDSEYGSGKKDTLKIQPLWLLLLPRISMSMIDNTGTNDQWMGTIVTEIMAR